MLNPLQEKVNEIRNDKANKEAKLEEAKAALDGLLEKKTILEVQLEEVSSLNPNRSLGFLCVVRQREIL